MEQMTYKGLLSGKLNDLKKQQQENKEQLNNLYIVIGRTVSETGGLITFPALHDKYKNLKDQESSLVSEIARTEESIYTIEVSEKLSCRKCGFVNSRGAEFCQKCGTKLGINAVRSCPHCGSINSDNFRFCADCGAFLGDIPTVQPVQAEAPTCPSCGKISSPDKKFCMFCGTRLGNTPKVNIIPIVTPPVTENPPAPKPVIIPEPIPAAIPSAPVQPAPAPVSATGLLVCPGCGKTAPQGRKFCMSCGSKLIPYIAPPAPAVTPVQPVIQSTAAAAPVQPVLQPAPAAAPVQPVLQPAPAAAPVQPVLQPTPAAATVQPVIQSVPAVQPAAVKQPVAPVTKSAPIEEPKVEPIKPEKKICPVCGASMNVDQTVCGVCGTDLTEGREPISKPAPKAKAESKPFVPAPVQELSEQELQVEFTESPSAAPDIQEPDQLPETQESFDEAVPETVSEETPSDELSPADPEESPACPECGAPTKPGRSFCIMCGAKLIKD